MKITIPVSVGELLDKITILQIKSETIDSFYINEELKCLTNIAKQNKVYDLFYLDKLSIVNRKLWDIENDLRTHEDRFIFDDEFIRKSRLVYTTNDERFKIKNEINKLMKTDIFEVKNYK